MSHQHRDIVVTKYQAQFSNIDEVCDFLREMEGQEVLLTVDLSIYQVTFDNYTLTRGWINV